MRRGPLFLRGVVVLAWSTVVWTALWAELTPVNVLWGVIVGALTLLLVPLPDRDRRPRVRLWPLLRFVTYFQWQLVRASAVVAWEVVTPRNRIHEGIVAAPLRTSSAGVITLIANAVSLTPGTLTLEATQDPPVLYVHILHLRTIDEVRGDIRRLEDLALAAFPTERSTSTSEQP
jgi:multicomponent Na+:H+ antiporter subunit E